MEYRLVILPTASVQLDLLSKSVKEQIMKKMHWLKRNADAVLHHPLVGMPPHLAGLCKLRSGDYRILYWKYPDKKLIEIFNVKHRSAVYRRL